MGKVNLLAHLYFPKDFFIFSILVLLLFSSSIVHATSNDCSNLFSKQFKENSPEKFLNWMDYESAKNYIQAQRIKTTGEFRRWTKSDKRPKNFPSNPHIIYKSEWKSWGDFFGTGNISNSKRNWMPYTEAKMYIQSQGIKTAGEFQDWRMLSDKRPKNFPSNPSRSYQTQWKSWGDFLGTINLKGNQKNWMDYESAKNYIQAQRIKTTREFGRWVKSDKRPKNFPSNPHIIYKSEWKSWGDFFGTGNISNSKRNWMPYTEAKMYIQSQGIKTAGEFQDWRMLSDKRPKNFPSNPSRSYQTQWRGWRHFLGNYRWMSYKKARAYAKQMSIQNNKEFVKWLNSDERPRNFPKDPHKYYSEWKSVEDFLRIKWMDYESAKNYIQAQRIKTTREFGRWVKSDKRPKNFPSNPHIIYKSEWKSWGDFFGTGNISNSKRNWMPYTEAKMYIQSQGIKTKREFGRWVKSDKRPKNFPSNPSRSYQTQWRGWRDFLGNYRWMSYKKARAYVQKMGIQNNKEFVKWLNSDERPRNFPKDPHKYYSEWKSVEDFLRIKWMPYRKAKSYVQSINIETKKEFFEWILSGKDQLEDFPSNPHKVYKEWEGWNEFLGVNQESRMIFHKKSEDFF